MQDFRNRLIINGFPLSLRSGQAALAATLLRKLTSRSAPASGV